MAVLQSFKRIIVEDFDSKDRDLVSKLAYAINNFAEDVINAFGNEITIEDNLNIVKKDFSVTVDKNGRTVGSATLKTGLNHTCDGITVIRATNLINSSHIPTATPFVTFTENSGLITISNISNLTAGEQYKLKLILF
jgi:hypothetical protein